MALAIINDYVVNRRLKLHLDQDDFAVADENWNVPDSLLVDLQHTKTFHGYNTWSSLEPQHYRFMIVTNIAKAFDAIADDLEEAQVTIRSLSFLICCMVRCLELRADCHVEMIRFSRVGAMDLAVEFEAALSMEETLRTKIADSPGLSVVVDNS